MKVTKYQHACFTVEKDEQILVVDPGGFSTDFIAPGSVVAIVITHEHGDHFDPDQLAAIIDKNPEAVIVSNAAVTAKIETFQSRTVAAGDRITIGSFDLEFFGDSHAVIHASIPKISNVGVLINDLLYYPGDSFTVPDQPVDTLALPAAAPWMKIGEAMDFLAAVKPRLAFPTHDAILSTEGKEVADRLLGMAAKNNIVEYRRLESPIEI
ncbi:MAG TPA: MBL fold metallo-hydrolase [Candidatus Saccharimonadales bacterium]|nr:MBL fold metallo-hydrolase [Candidatus Saccharimonadales bacterium]